MPKKKLRALLVGINKYDPNSQGVSDLSGCYKDVVSIHSYLSTSYPESHPEIELQAKVLVDNEATRDGIISAFEKHLIDGVEEGDIVYFHYSGHGSREPAPKEFLEYFQEGKNETLVCYDSRTPGGMDLADKELGAMLSRIPKGTHILMTADSCNSGSITRSVGQVGAFKTRQSPGRNDEPRKLETYYKGFYSDMLAKTKALTLPSSSHMSLSACRRTELAKEGNGQGLFTSTLVTALSDPLADRSYAGLYSRINQIVLNHGMDQHPQIEYYGDVMPLATFLENKLESELPTPEVKQIMGSDMWILKYGAINGLGLGLDSIENLKVPIFVAGKPEEIIAIGTITNLGLQECEMKVELKKARPMLETPLRAQVLGASMPVYIQDEESVGIFKEVFEKSKGTLLQVSNPEEASYHVRVSDKSYSVYTRDPEKFVFGFTFENSEKSYRDSATPPAAYIVKILQKIANWERFLTLENPKTEISPDQVSLKAYVNGSEKALEEDLIVLDYVLVDKKDKSGNPVKDNATGKVKKTGERVEVKLAATNKYNQPLHFNLVYLSPKFEIKRMAEDAGQIPIAPNEVQLLQKALGMRVSNPDMTEETDRFLLIASTDPLENHFYEQIGLKKEYYGKTAPVSWWELNNTRGVDDEDDEPQEEPRTDWTVKKLTIKMVQKIAAITDQPIGLAQNKIQIQGHKAFKADLNLQGTPPATRSVGTNVAIDKVVDRIPNTKLVQLGASSSGPQVALEISGFENEAVLKENPLKMTLNESMSEEEEILPFTFDGEFFIPVGKATKTGDNTTEIEIDYLPKEKQNTRSLGGALKLYFLKATMGRKGNQLRRVEYLDDGSSIERTTDGLQEAVDKAQNILLVVHGIIGDTEEMAQSVYFAQQSGKYDLILTYDYENLSTQISKTAQMLKESLIELGVHKKNVEIMAHSMGGLVSRWLVEKEHGDKFVSRLIMLGTPNNGSFFSKLAPVIPALIALAANFQSPVLGGLIYAMNFLNKNSAVNKTLADMDGDSDILRDLNASEPPKTEYVVIGGNAKDYQGPEGSSFSRLMDKVIVGVGNLVYQDKNHDVAVEVDSIFQLRQRPSLTEYTVPCHHMVYFSNQESLKVLKEVMA